MSFLVTSVMLLVFLNNGVECSPNAWMYREFCKTKRFPMRVYAPGCESKEIRNNFCYGQCRSQFIPVGWKPEYDHREVPCSNCIPVKWVTRKVVLNCPGQTKNFNVQKIQIIKKCKCKVASCRVMTDFY